MTHDRETAETLRILQAARELLSDPERWTKGTFARDSRGRRVDATWTSAVCFCSLGAIERAAASFDAIDMMSITRGPAVDRAGAALLSAINTGERRWYVIGDWNDSARTHADVLAAFDRAIAAEEARHG